MTMKRRNSTVLALILALSGCQSRRPEHAGQPADTLSADVIVKWSEVAYQGLVARDKYASPLWASRLLEMMHIAQHDAVAAVTRRYLPYAFDRQEPGADPIVAAAAAAHGVLVAALPEQRAMLDQALQASLAQAGADSERR